MKAAVYTGPGRIELKEQPDPTVGPGDILLRVKSCGLCGTDIRKVRLGLVDPPAVLGHEVAGEVAAVGAGTAKFRVGDRVVAAHHTPCLTCHYCRHGNVSMCRRFKTSRLDPGGFAQYVRLPAGHVESAAFGIPEEISYDEAVFMEPLACVLRNVKRAALLPGDTALIVGLGSMGLLTGQLVRRAAGRVVATEPRADRRAAGRRLGFDRVLEAGDPSLKESVRALTEGRGVDLAVLTAGGAELYGKILELVRDGGRVSIFAAPGPGEKVSYEAEELYHREITIYSTYSSSPEDLYEALEFLRAGEVSVKILKAERFGLRDLAAAIDAAGAGSILKAIVAPEADNP